MIVAYIIQKSQNHMPADTKTDSEPPRAKNKPTNTENELARKQSDLSQKLRSSFQELIADEKGNVVLKKKLL